MLHGTRQSDDQRRSRRRPTLAASATLIALAVVASAAGLAWRGRARPGQLALAAAVGPAIATRPASSPAKRRSSRACVPGDPCLVIVIDDIGRALEPLEQLLALKLDLTFGVLPHARHTARSVRLLRAAGREYLLHLPMQPRDPRAITDEPFVLDRHAPLELIVRDSLARVPGAVGVNNHMGSALSEDRRSMLRVFAQVREQRPDALVLDSRTSAESRICAAAMAYGLPCTRRDVFLDDPRDTATVTERLEESVRLARRRGWAVAIGHPIAATIAALTRLERRVYRERWDPSPGEQEMRPGGRRGGDRYPGVVSLSRGFAPAADGA